MVTQAYLQVSLIARPGPTPSLFLTIYNSENLKILKILI